MSCSLWYWCPSGQGCLQESIYQTIQCESRDTSLTPGWEAAKTNILQVLLQLPHPGGPHPGCTPSNRWPLWYFPPASVHRRRNSPRLDVRQQHQKDLMVNGLLSFVLVVSISHPRSSITMVLNKMQVLYIFFQYTSSAELNEQDIIHLKKNMHISFSIAL